MRSTGKRRRRTGLSTLTETTMRSSVIQLIDAIDARFSLPEGAGSDAMHTSPAYAMSLTQMKTERGPTGVGLALALGDGNRLVCEAIRILAQPLIGQPIEEVMAAFGEVARKVGMISLCDGSDRIKEWCILRWLRSRMPVGTSGPRAAAYRSG